MPIRALVWNENIHERGARRRVCGDYPLSGGRTT